MKKQNRINATSLTYQGLVDVSYYINGKKVRFKGHNEGLPAMFKYISRILAGDLTSAANDSPTYVDIVCEWSDNVELNKESVLYSPLSISEPVYEYNSGLQSWITRFKIVLSYNMIDFDKLENIVPSEADTYIYLLSNVGDEFARLKLKEDDIKLTDIVPGTQGLIQWTLIFENKVEV